MPVINRVVQGGLKSFVCKGKNLMYTSWSIRIALKLRIWGHLALSLFVCPTKRGCHCAQALAPCSPTKQDDGQLSTTHTHSSASFTPLTAVPAWILAQGRGGGWGRGRGRGRGGAGRGPLTIGSCAQRCPCTDLFSLRTVHSILAVRPLMAL